LGLQASMSEKRTVALANAVRSAERLGGDRRKAAVGDLVEGPADAAPAEGQLYLAAFGECWIAGVAGDLPSRSAAGLALRRRRVDRRPGGAPARTRADRRGQRPELARLGASVSGIEHHAIVSSARGCLGSESDKKASP
jgi:hypothetical protein